MNLVCIVFFLLFCVAFVTQGFIMESIKIPFKIDMGITLTTIICCCLFACTLHFTTPTFYYMEAEIVKSDTLGVTFAEYGTDGSRQYYYWCNPSEYDEQPYLLTMATNGTYTKTDDEIVVVWR